MIGVIRPANSTCPKTGSRGPLLACALSPGPSSARFPAKPGVTDTFRFKADLARHGLREPQNRALTPFRERHRPARSSSQTGKGPARPPARSAATASPNPVEPGTAENVPAQKDDRVPRKASRRDTPRKGLQTCQPVPVPHRRRLRPPPTTATGNARSSSACRQPAPKHGRPAPFPAPAQSQKGAPDPAPYRQRNTPVPPQTLPAGRRARIPQPPQKPPAAWTTAAARGAVRGPRATPCPGPSWRTVLRKEVRRCMCSSVHPERAAFDDPRPQSAPPSQSSLRTGGQRSVHPVAWAAFFGTLEDHTLDREGPTDQAV